MSDETDQLVEDLVYAGRILERFDDSRLKPLCLDNIRQYGAARERIYHAKLRLGKSCEHQWVLYSYTDVKFGGRLAKMCARCSEVRWDDAVQPTGRVPEVVREVLAELANATAKFPDWPSDPLHAVGVVNGEVGELSKAVLQQVYEPHQNQPGDVRKEAVQAAAMLIRFIESMGAYRFAPGAQHRQGSY